MDISLIIPAFEEGHNLRPLLEEAQAVLSGLRVEYEIIVVDDGSTDGSQALLRELQSQSPFLKVILLRRNFGQSAAVDAGFRQATGRVVVTMDADLQNDPHDIPAMLARLEEGFDVVSGWRLPRADSWLRRLPSRFANAIVRLVTGVRVHDLGCSLKAYRREIVSELRLYGEMHRLLVPLAASLGARVAEMKVNHRPRLHGRSKYGMSRVLKLPVDLLTLWFLRGYQTKPLYVFGGAGLLLALVAFATAGFVLWQKYDQGIWVHKNPLFIVAVLFGLVSVQALGTGLIAELLIRTYFESSKRTTYSIAEKLGVPDGQ